MTHRYAAKTDANHTDIMSDFRKLCCGVYSAHQYGGGFTDLIVEISEFNILVEVKDGNKPPSKRKLTPQQELFHKAWRGHKAIVKDSFEVEALVRSYREYAHKIQNAGIKLGGEDEAQVHHA